MTKWYSRYAISQESAPWAVVYGSDALHNPLEFSAVSPCFLPSEIARDLPVKDRPVLAATIHCGCRLSLTGGKTHFGALHGPHLSYSSCDRTRPAVERSFEIIGKALNRSFKIVPEQIDSIRNNLQIIWLRNIPAHCYDTVEQKCWSSAFTKQSCL